MTDTPVSADASERALSHRAVCDMLDVCRQTFWKIRRTDPNFPKPRLLAPSGERFLASEIAAYLRSLPVAGNQAPAKRTREGKP
jgi:predicted DNA-binding transcriptional regulator AlpA